MILWCVVVASSIWWASTRTEAEEKINILRRTNGIVEFSENNNRARVVTQIISDLHLENASLLDFGGVNVRIFEGFNIVKCLNLEKCTGTTCSRTDCILYDGLNIPFLPKSFDVIISEFVLHHTSDNTITILKQLNLACKKYMIIGEDISSLYASRQWQTILFNHDPNGVFRSNREWVEIFNLLGLRLLKTVVMKRCTFDSKLLKKPIKTPPCMLIYLLQCDRSNPGF